MSPNRVADALAEAVGGCERVDETGPIGEQVSQCGVDLNSLVRDGVYGGQLLLVSEEHDFGAMGSGYGSAINRSLSRFIHQYDVELRECAEYREAVEGGPNAEGPGGFHLRFFDFLQRFAEIWVFGPAAFLGDPVPEIGECFQDDLERILHGLV